MEGDSVGDSEEGGDSEGGSEGFLRKKVRGDFNGGDCGLANSSNSFNRLRHVIGNPKCIADDLEDLHKVVCDDGICSTGGRFSDGVDFSERRDVTKGSRAVRSNTDVEGWKVNCSREAHVSCPPGNETQTMEDGYGISLSPKLQLVTDSGSMLNSRSEANGMNEGFARLGVSERNVSNANREKLGSDCGIAGQFGAVRKLFSLFVDNIPLGTSRRRIWEIFRKYGNVCSVFISRKQRRGSRNLFGFVRFLSRRDAEAAMRETNGLRVDDQVLYVNVPLFKQNPANFNRIKGLGSGPDGIDSGSLSGKPDFPPIQSSFRSYAHVVSGEVPAFFNKDLKVSKEEGSSIVKALNGKNKFLGKDFNLEWLNRCAVAYVKLPNTDHKIAEVLMREFKELRNVCFLGNQQLLIEFCSSVIRDEFITLGIWDELFALIKPWDASVTGSERSVWLECSGVPIQSWSISTFNQIANFWGSLVCVFEDTLNFKNLCKAYFLISTKEEVIGNAFDFVVDNKSFRVNVREVGVPGGFKFDAKQRVEGIIEVCFDSVGTDCPSEGRGYIQSRGPGFQVLDAQAEDICSSFSVVCCDLQTGSFRAGDEGQNFKILSSVEAVSEGFLNPGESMPHDTSKTIEGYRHSYSQPTAVDVVSLEGPSVIQQMPLMGSELYSVVVPVDGFKDGILNANKEVGVMWQGITGVRPEDTSLLGDKQLLMEGVGAFSSLSNVQKEPLEPGRAVLGRGDAVMDSESDAKYEEVISKPVNTQNLTGPLKLSMAKLEAIRHSIVEGISETIEMGLAMGIEVPLDVQVYIKAAMVKRQMYAMKRIFANG